MENAATITLVAGSIRPEPTTNGFTLVIRHRLRGDEFKAAKAKGLPIWKKFRFHRDDLDKSDAMKLRAKILASGDPIFIPRTALHLALIKAGKMPITPRKRSRFMAVVTLRRDCWIQLLVPKGTGGCKIQWHNGIVPDWYEKD
jgi:hypothetical protein